MCTPKAPAPPPPPPPPPAPPPPPPAPEPSAEAPVVAEGAQRTQAENTKKKANRKGTSSLQIDLNVPQAGGNGLNIPQG